ncbi:MAG: PEP-CTERM sorting domain-containing protein [Pseudomonadota bacterium]
MISPVLSLKALPCLLLAFAGSVSAATYTNVPSGANTGLPFAYFGNSASSSGDSPKVGQVFALASDAVLSSFSFYVIGDKSLSLQLNVAQWNPDTNEKNQAVNSVGQNLLTTSIAAVQTFSATSGVTTVQFNNLGLSLNADTKYVAYLTSDDPTVTGIQLSRTQTAADGSGFGLGNAYLGTTPGVGWQLPFNGNGFLSLQYTAVTAPVPEPGAYALLFAGLCVVGAATLRRKQA